MQSDEYRDLANRVFEVAQQETDLSLRSEFEDVAAAFQFMADYTLGLADWGVLFQILH